MAFNPFDLFRRNQRILFAGLTVVIMLMFVLSFGQGDVISLIPQWLSTRARTGEVLAVVDGSKLYQSQLGDIEVNRLLANEYMSRAAGITANNAQKSVFANLEKVSAPNKPVIERALQNMQVGFMPTTMQAMQFYREYGIGAAPSDGEMIAEREGTFARTINDLKGIEQAPNPQEADQTAARNLQQLIDIQRRLGAGSGRNAVYFFNAPNNNVKDRVDFYLWLKKADQLGIKYTDADIIEMTNNEFFNKLTNEDWSTVEGGMRGKQGFTPERLRAALGDEFRVRAAQSAVLGTSFLEVEGRSFDAPASYYDFYKKQVAPATFTLIPFPADNYLDKVTGTPDETTRRELFQTGRNEDPNPALPTFGLREPRKLKVEYVELKGDEPFYLTAASDVIQKSQLLAQLNASLLAPLGGQSSFTALTAVATVNQPNLLTNGLYKSYLDDHRNKLQQSWMSLFPSAVQPDTNLIQPQVPIALIASLHGTGNPFTALGGYIGALALADQKTRIETLPAIFAAPILPGLGQLTIGLGSVAPTINAVQPLPQKAVQTLLMEQLKKTQTQTVAQADIQKLTKELADSNYPADSAEAKAKIAEFVKTRGLKQGASKEFRDMYSIFYDEGLASLRAKADTPNPFNPTKLTPLGFGQRFFYDMDPATRRPMPSTGFFKPQPIAAGLPTMYFWRSAEVVAEPLRDPNSPEARTKTEAAWKQKQARDLAKKAADDFAKKCETLGVTRAEIEPKLNQMTAELAASFNLPSAKEKVRLFTIEDVAPVVATTSPGFQPRRQIGSFVLKPSDDLQYPTSKLAADLVAAKDKPIGTSLVVVDNSNNMYYVAVVTNRREPSIDEFRLQVYGNASVQSEYRPLLTRIHQNELRKENYEQALALLKAEFGYDQENEKIMKATDLE